MPESIARHIDHTLLKPEATVAQIENLCREAREFRFFSVCVNGCHIEPARRLLAGSGVKVVTVIGFPLGAMLTWAKAAETRLALAAGAEELDMVANIGWLKSGRSQAVREDIEAVVAAAAGRPVKVIIETALLSTEEKETAARLVVDAGAAFVKTSTGFSGGGATVEDVRLLAEVTGGRVGVKASGGIKNLAAAQAMMAAGATRLGTSSGVAIVLEEREIERAKTIT
ncbi:MAG: deoxyribose-phosphate aldolase [bacterium]